MDEPRFLSGKLLLAMPGMADPRFERAVIALCVHDENGAVGIGIGQKRAGMAQCFGSAILYPALLENEEDYIVKLPLHNQYDIRFGT